MTLEQPRRAHNAKKRCKQRKRQPTTSVRWKNLLPMSDRNNSIYMRDKKIQMKWKLHDQWWSLKARKFPNRLSETSIAIRVMRKWSFRLSSWLKRHMIGSRSVSSTLRVKDTHKRRKGTCLRGSSSIERVSLLVKMIIIKRFRPLSDKKISKPVKNLSYLHSTIISGLILIIYLKKDHLLLVWSWIKNIRIL